MCPEMGCARGIEHTADASWMATSEQRALSLFLRQGQLKLAGITRPALEQRQHDGPRGVDLQLEDVATGPLGRVVVAGTR